MFLNEDEMVETMKRLGFHVVVASAKGMSNLDKFSDVVKLMQCYGRRPWCRHGQCSILACRGSDGETYFGKPVSDIGVKYLEYKIETEESSLFDMHGPEHPIVADPASVFLKGYYAARAAYVDGQNMKINLERFRETLIQAMKLVGQ